MTNKCKILLDSRRRINSGVGRVSQWVSNNINKIADGCVCHHLVTDERGRAEYDLAPDVCISANIYPFSSNELYELPELISRSNYDLYINPQVTWSPFNAVKSINIIHDLWAINNPEWLPTINDLKNRFGLLDIAYFEHLVDWFSTKHAKKMLTQEGYLRFSKAWNSENIVWKGVWIQYAATVHLSARTVAVSDFVKNEMVRLFPRAEQTVVIPNVPRDFYCVDEKYEYRHRKHILVLSKIEPRKNLDFLLDAYIEYADKVGIEVIPLVIAGDPGYKTVANNLLSRINSLSKDGYQILVMPSVSDIVLSDLFYSAACLICPSHFEGFGLPPLEAMLAQVPVITTRTGMMNTTLGDFAIKIDGDNSSELARQIISVLANDITFEYLHNARCAVLNFIDLVDSIGLWKKTIKEVLVDLVD